MADQIITLSTPNNAIAVGQQFTVTVNYNVSDADNTLTGVGFGIHFDSTKLRLDTIIPTFTSSLFGTPAAANEGFSDNDAATNQQISWQYLDFAGSWPNQTLPLTLGTLTFTALAATSTSNLNVTLSSLAPGYTGQAASLPLTLFSTPTLAISPTTVSQNEGNSGTTPFTFTVTRSGDTSTASSASFAVTGTGTNPPNAADFGTALPTGTVNFLAGETTKTITVNVVGDSIFETGEIFNVTLSNPVGAILSTAKATGLITNDDAAPVFAIASAAATEGGAITFTVTRTGNAQATQSVTLVTSIGASDTASANDFTSSTSTSTLFFATGETSKTFTFQTTQDTLFEGNETFTTTLSFPTNGATISTTNGSATGTINNDDAAPVFAIASASATEGGAITFTVTRTGDAQSTQSVTFATSIGAANTTSATDFTANTGTLSFATGETSKTFTVQTTQDTLFEGNETFTATLSAATNGATISTTNGSVTGTINNDDAAPVFAIASASATEGGAITFIVTRTGDAQSTQSVTFATSIGTGDTASATDVGIGATSVLSFMPGQTSNSITLQAVQDTLFEGNETFTITLSAATNGATISTTNGAATGTINNDDAAPVFAIASASATEGGAIIFTVTRTGNAQATQSVTVATSIGATDTASATDFTANTGTLSFATGETSKTFTVQTTQDTLTEGNETFTVALTNPTNGATLSATNGSATGTINNDDFAQQQITSLTNLKARPGQVVSIPLFYNTSTADNTLPGIGIRLHYNSANLSFKDVTNLFSNSIFGAVTDNADTANFDNNTSTNRFVQLQYLDFAGNWPNQTLPVKLGDFNFTAQTGFADTQLNVTSPDGTLAAGYGLKADPLLVAKQTWNFDIDGDGKVGALSDGLIAVRYLFGSAFAGNALTNGAISPTATRSLTEIQAYLQEGVTQKFLDVDGNGSVGALSDGLIAVRYLFGSAFAGTALIDGAIAPDATRNLAGIQSYMAGLTTLT